MKKLIFCILFSAALNLAAQKVIDVSKESSKDLVLQSFYIVGGEPFSNLQYARIIEGSPFYNDKWMKGTG